MYKSRFSRPDPARDEVRKGDDKGAPVVVAYPDSPQSKAIDGVAEEVARQISIEAMMPELTILTRAQ